MAQKLLASEIVYIAPTNCGSTVGYTIKSQKNYDSDTKGYYPSFYASIDLTDCSRKISWQFENTEESLAKINRTIEILTSFKKEFVNAQKKYPKRNNENPDS
jgi:hypothetical protein